MVKTVRCPTCRKEVPQDSPDMPFCSDRCRVVDLGAWASGEYRISSPIFDPELLEEVEQAQINRPQGNRARGNAERYSRSDD